MSSSRNFWTEHRALLTVVSGVLVVLWVWALGFPKGGGIIALTAWRHPAVNDFFITITRLAEPLSYFIIGVALLFYRFGAAFLVGATGFLSLGISRAIKLLFRQPRPVRYFREMEIPPEVYQPLSDVELHVGMSSFPSGHTMAGFGLFVLLGFLLPVRSWGWAIFWCFLALLVGLSRMYMVLHFSLDVAAGATLGTVLAIVLARLDRIINRRWPQIWSKRFGDHQMFKNP